MKIVSLLPGATEMVYALGLGDRLVAVSHECDFPHAAKALPSVTSALVPAGASSGEIDRIVREHTDAFAPLYTLDADTLAALEPDLIITQTLCNVCAVSKRDVHAVSRRLPRRPEIVNLETRTFGDLFAGLALLGERTGTTAAAAEVSAGLQRRVTRVLTRTAQRRQDTRVAFLEWVDPIFAGGHWNPELVTMAGGHDPLGRRGEPARVVGWEEVAAFRPELVFVTCCGFTLDRMLQDVPLLERLPGWRDLPAVRSGRVYVADGTQYFSRPGPRLVDSLEMLAHAIDPMLHDLPTGVPAARRLVPVTA